MVATFFFETLNHHLTIMKKVIHSIKAFGLTLMTAATIVACAQLSDLQQDTKHGGNTLPKTWTGKQILSVRYKLEDGNYQFVKSKDSVQTEIVIKTNGQVTGRIGNATLVEAKIVKNRNTIGRMLNLATDYALEGKLQGFTFENDTFYIKEITVPLWQENGYLYGDLFMNKGLRIYPMGSLKLH